MSRVKLDSMLDWHETVYTPAQLLEMADAVRDHTGGIAAKRRGVWNTAVEGTLRALAGSPAALNALNHRRPTPPARVVALNRAVHAHVLTALMSDWKPGQVHKDVAEVWGVTRGQVKDDLSEYRAHGTRWRPDDAERLMQMIVHNTCRVRTGKRRSSRDDVLEDFDKDLRDRAAKVRRKK